MAVRKLGLPMFVKPANQGSSVGVSKVNDEAEYLAAVELKLGRQMNGLAGAVLEQFCDPCLRHCSNPQ